MRLTGLWWWIDRWRKSTAYTDMTLEQQGAYRNLLDEAALRGGAIPNNEDVLAKACGDARRWKRLRPAVMPRFTLEADGWHNETMDGVIAESSRRAAKQKRYRQGVNGPSVVAIIERDGTVCGICAEPLEPELAELDHIIPVKIGGHVTDVRNLQLAHPRCNQKKGAHGKQRHDRLLPVAQGLSRGNDQSNTQGNEHRPPNPDPVFPPKTGDARANGAGSRGGLMGGSMPIDHGDCISHGPICLKPRFAKELRPLFTSEIALQRWADGVGERWTAALERGDRLYTADGFEFWRTEYKRDFGAKQTPISDGRRVETSDETATYLATLRAVK